MLNTETPVFCKTQEAILKTLLYFQIFSYPLTEGEIFEFLQAKRAVKDKLKLRLQSLEAQGAIFKKGDFYLTRDEPTWIEKRLENNKRAEKHLPIARKMARFIGSFPFVRAVFVSGSLSKNCMSPDSDIDYFVITKPGRLWLSRTMLVFFKKIFLFNSHKFFCVNYFIDTEHLEIEEKNLFTATETKTLLPMYGKEFYTQFLEKNAWADAFYPQFAPRNTENVPSSKRGFLKIFFEYLLNGAIGDWLNQKSMSLTVFFWKRKFKHIDPKIFEIALKSRQHVSKHHPEFYQKRVLEAFSEELSKRGIEVRNQS